MSERKQRWRAWLIVAVSIALVGCVAISRFLVVGYLDVPDGKQASMRAAVIATIGKAVQPLGFIGGTTPDGPYAYEIGVGTFGPDERVDILTDTSSKQIQISVLDYNAIGSASEFDTKVIAAIQHQVKASFGTQIDFKQIGSFDA